MSKIMYTIVDKNNKPVRFEVIDEVVRMVFIYEESVDNCFVYRNDSSAQEDIEYYTGDSDALQLCGVELPLKVVKVKFNKELILE